jgi:hypothetical protein
VGIAYATALVTPLQSQDKSNAEHMVDATLSRQLYIALDWRIELVMPIQLLGEKERSFGMHN